MPAYDYRCKKCGKTFERQQRITEAPAAVCPQCNGTDCQRVITGGAFHLKGAGFYANDYRPKPSSR